MLANHISEATYKSQLFGVFLLPFIPSLLAGGLITGGALLSTFIGEELIVLAIPGILLLSPGFAAMMLDLSQSRTREAEADYIGALLMTDAGYDPMAMAAVFEAMASREKQVLESLQQQYGKKNVKVINEWQRTHPNVREQSRIVIS